MVKQFINCAGHTQSGTLATSEKAILSHRLNLLNKMVEKTVVIINDNRFLFNEF